MVGKKSFNVCLSPIMCLKYDLQRELHKKYNFKLIMNLCTFEDQLEHHDDLIYYTDFICSTQLVSV